MTIALGILASDGIVVAADREEQIPNFMKVSQCKVRIVTMAGTSHSGSCVIAGAGDSGPHIDALAENLAQAFTVHSELVGNELQASLSEAVEQFHHDHIFPMSPYRDQRPSLEMIIACERNPTRLLLDTLDTVTNARTPFAAVGIGGLAARGMLGRLYRRMDMFSTALLAAYVTYHVKEMIPGCGKFTDVVCVSGNKLYTLLPRGLAELELSFADHALTESLIAEYLFKKDKPDVTALIAKLTADRETFQGLGLRSQSGTSHVFSASEAGDAGPLFQQIIGQEGQSAPQSPTDDQPGRPPSQE